MKLTFRQLHAFVTVARLGSFTRAADDIHITQAGLSLMIKEMEDQLGYRLFDRTTRAVWLTEAGARFLPVVTKAMQEIDDMAGRLARDEEQAHHFLTIAATPLVCGTILPDVMREFHATHPHIKLVVKDVERPFIQAMVERGEVDLGLGILLKPVSGIQRESLHQLSLLCISPKTKKVKGKQPQSKRQTVSWSELKSSPLIGLPADNDIQQLIDGHLEQIERANESRATFHNMLTVIAMVEAGLGQAVLPSFVRAACQRYQVDVWDLAKPHVPLDLYVISKRGVSAPSAAPIFIEAFSQHLGKIDAYRG